MSVRVYVWRNHEERVETIQASSYYHVFLRWVVKEIGGFSYFALEVFLPAGGAEIRYQSVLICELAVLPSFEPLFSFCFGVL